ncbi:MAG TPA: hypothetical protein VFE47_15995 [Tepidisphaeraceae bacterium]|jgi:hypothetical protein|nr:hypothetical protein [Tepidisphaeraceae bacterium]
MTSADVKSELGKNPFVAIRIHMVSGKTVDVKMSTGATVLQNAVFVLRDPTGKDDDAGYEVIALRNIERLEQIKPRRKRKSS